MFEKLKHYLPKQTQVWNSYGPAEATVDSTMYIVDMAEKIAALPIGVPLPHYQCLILDGFLESVIVSQEGELCIGGLAVFAGYFGRNDLTAKAIIEINGERYYRTGDVVAMDKYGFLHFRRRNDYQVKLRGQRIEIGEVERCLLDASITACIVMKWDDDHLIAYVQGSNINEEDIRRHCQMKLPTHMIPAYFIVLEQWPLNINGKIDRKRLPPPANFTRAHPLNFESSLQMRNLDNEIITQIYNIWCSVLQQHQINRETNIFTIGGHSLLFMQIYQQYQLLFYLGKKSLSLNDLFQCPTISGHAKLIQEAIKMERCYESDWSAIHIIRGRRN